MSSIVDQIVDESELARAAGEASCERWYPVFMNWAANHMHDLEILLRAAHMDGYRAGLKAKLIERQGAFQRQAKAAGRVAREAEERLQRADLAQELTR